METGGKILSVEGVAYKMVTSWKGEPLVKPTLVPVDMESNNFRTAACFL